MHVSVIKIPIGESAGMSEQTEKQEVHICRKGFIVDQQKDLL